VATPLGENTDFRNDRAGRSLAISDAIAELIIEHEQHMRELFPEQRWPILR
jgi:hypothetical protein